jgi:hypothetical protein
MPSSHLAWLEIVIKNIVTVRSMRLAIFQIVLIFLLGGVVGYMINATKEGFQTVPSTPANPVCSSCGGQSPCPDHPQDRGQCPLCPAYPDMSKYTLKTSVPPCPSVPDMSQYMLKTECPPVPDLSQYVLKSSIPKQQPIIVDRSACKGQCGDGPPCPRPRCPDVKCPAPTVCPKCPPCERQACPEPKIQCKAEDTRPSQVRPYLAPLSGAFGTF